MFITREEAKQKIKEILDRDEPIKTGQTLPIRKGELFKVYKIPLDYLVPNVLNDRIAWKIREFEAEHGRKLSSNNQEDVEYVYELIDKETPKENERTLKDIAEKGQLVDGIITNDGIIIDGNRRATLIRKLFKGDALNFKANPESFRFFNAIVLPETIDSKEIMALETRLQIGEDKKIDYNPICIYIKVDNLSKADYNDQQIAAYMGKKEIDIKGYRERFKLMNEYLEFIGKPEHYTLLDGLEDQFISTRTVFKKLDNRTYDAQDGQYSDQDIADFKQVCFDYMRAKYEGKEYRDFLIGKPNKPRGVFIKKSVWDEFYKNHEKIIEANNPQNEHDWMALGKNQFVQNLRNATEKLSDFNKERDVTSLVSVILGKVKYLKELMKNSEQLNEDDYQKLKEANHDIWEIIKDYE